MSADTRAAARPGRRVAAAARIRRGSVAVLALTVLEYGLGMYVNLYVSVPGADRGGDLGTAIANGPAVLSVHAVTGLLLGLGALAVLIQAVLARHRAAIAASALGLLSLAFADVAGAAPPAAATRVPRWGWPCSPPPRCCATRPTCTCSATPAHPRRRHDLDAGPGLQDAGTTGAGKSRV